jgi:hypothetical protein
VLQPELPPKSLQLLVACGAAPQLQQGCLQVGLVPLPLLLLPPLLVAAQLQMAKANRQQGQQTWQPSTSSSSRRPRAFAVRLKQCWQQPWQAVVRLGLMAPALLLLVVPVLVLQRSRLLVLSSSVAVLTRQHQLACLMSWWQQSRCCRRQYSR